MDDKNLRNEYTTVKELCYHLCAPLAEDLKKNIVKSVSNEISSSRKHCNSVDDSLDNDEFTLSSNIEKQLISLNKVKDIPRFRHLSKRLNRKEFSSLLFNRQAILSFFLNVSEAKHSKHNKELLLSRRSCPTYSQPKSVISPSNSSSSLKGSGEALDQSISSDNGHCSSQPSSIPRPTSLSNNIFLRRDGGLKTPTKPILVQPTVRSITTNHSYRSSSYESISIFTASPQYSKYKKTEVSESTVIKELLYCFQGIEGNLLKLDHNLGFTIDPQVRIPQRQMVERMMELGFLHNSVVNQCKNLEKGGTVSRAILTAVRKSLTDYYGLIGSLHPDWLDCEKTSGDTPLSEDGVDEGGLTLRRLFFLTVGPTQLLQIILDALSALRNMRGTCVTTALDILRHHGDHNYRIVVTSLIVHAGRPIVKMIINWLVEGKLFDPDGEFFITVNTNCLDRDVWRNKFILRQDLIPSVMSEEQAHMILRAGKAIHFLNVICEKQTPITGSRERLHKMKDVNILDLSDPRSELSETIAAIFVETSKQVLDTLVNQFKLFHHFQGIRRYILLGQGDFVNYYMELVEPEMRKAANQLQFHELMSLKALAERATLAHYEEAEILNRVSVKLLVASGGDWGSDVFGLQYLMHEPLDAALKLSDGAYSHMFNFLWRTKRMENILLRLRKERWATKNSLNWLACRIPDINGVLVLADRLSHELLHFTREFHYYILFEVVECLWEKFSQSFNKAKSFDDVINAHDNFINEMQAKTFQDEDSRSFINELRLIWDLVFELEALEEMFFNHLAKEYSSRVKREEDINQYGTCLEMEADIRDSDRKFKSYLSNLRAQYKILNRNYQDVLKKFLLGLSSTRKHELRLLSSRIDYNEYYKKIDARLTESMKYSRCSDLFN